MSVLVLDVIECLCCSHASKDQGGDLAGDCQRIHLAREPSKTCKLLLEVERVMESLCAIQGLATGVSESSKSPASPQAGGWAEPQGKAQ